MEALFFIPVIISAILIPLIALIDILIHEFTGFNKLVWVLVVLFFPLLGAILYFFIGRSQKIRNYRRRF